MTAPVRIHDDVLASHLPEETILLHMGTKKYYRLNETAAVIWKALEEGSGREAIVEKLVARYEVTEAEAREGLREQLGRLADAELITQGEET